MITVLLCCLYTAEITKANEEVMKVINLYDEVINKADISSLLVDDNHGKLSHTS